jgi:hypothetical protein
MSIRNRLLDPSGTPYRDKKHLPIDANEDDEFDHVLRIFRAHEAVTTNTTVRQIWKREDPKGSVSARQRNQNWAWFNQGFLRTKSKTGLRVHGV